MREKCVRESELEHKCAFVLVNVCVYVCVVIGECVCEREIYCVHGCAYEREILCVYACVCIRVCVREMREYRICMWGSMQVLCIRVSVCTFHELESKYKLRVRMGERERVA